MYYLTTKQLYYIHVQDGYLFLKTRYMTFILQMIYMVAIKLCPRIKWKLPLRIRLAISIDQLDFRSKSCRRYN